MVKFSIVVPCYNVGSYLHFCLDSVLAQSCADWECLCVDDGSTDDTGSILDEYALRDTRVRVFHQKNAGEGAARNTALDHATGDYICFLDGDDAYNKDAIRLLSNAVSKYGDVDVLCFGAMHKSTDVHDGFVDSDLGDVAITSGEMKIDSVSYRRFRLAGGCMVYNRKSMGDIRFCSKVIGADMDMSYNMYWKAKKWTFIDAAVYYYLQRDTSAIHVKPTLRSVKDAIDLELELVQKLIANRSRWTLPDMQDFLRWDASFTYYTFRSMFFALPNHEMQKCLPTWLKVQHELWKIGGYPLKFKIKTALITICPLAVTVRLVTRLIGGLDRRTAGLRSRIYKLGMRGSDPIEYVGLNMSRRG